MNRSNRPRPLPSNHRLVYDVVRNQAQGSHASAGDIFARARALKPTLGYSTVYRALARLCETGLVLELQVPGLGAALYEPARSNHAHFICRLCGRIDDLDGDSPAELMRAEVEAIGAEIDHVSLTVHGCCARCRTSPAGTSAP